MALSENERAAMTSSKTPEWGTPWSLFWRLDEEFSLNLDVCATPLNAKCSRYFTREDDGLAKEWAGRCWMNPPYGREIIKWIRKAYESSLKEAEIVVCLLPARVDTEWFHEWVWGKAEVRFLRGRVRFIDESGRQADPALFPSMVAIYRRRC
ncbi:MAG: DNA N-6-adenine-methyltransferase [Methanomassiliicoccus sp.]|nr:DNA N-6-adenine-methyltransferase [Methanomassiliicoccus sp.]